MKKFTVKNYKGNIVESLSKFQKAYKGMKIVEAKEEDGKLKVTAESIGKEESMRNLNIWIGGYLYNSEDDFRNGNAEELANEFLEDYDCDLSIDEIVSEIEWAQKNAEVEE